jgi:hypothetical protein
MKSLANSAFKLSLFELALNSPFELPPTDAVIAVAFQ